MNEARKPREFWICGKFIYTDLGFAGQYHDPKNLIHVREVIEGEPEHNARKFTETESRLAMEIVESGKYKSLCEELAAELWKIENCMNEDYDKWGEMTLARVVSRANLALAKYREAVK